MRLFDFIVFYPMASFKKRNVTEFTWQTPLERATILAATTTSLLLFTGIEISCFLILKVNILDIWYTIFSFLIGGILIIQLFNYIYIKRKRYEYIISPEYRPFKLNIIIGVIMCFFLFVASLLAAIAAGVIQGNLLDNK
jgi:hypothetical protein